MKQSHCTTKWESELDAIAQLKNALQGWVKKTQEKREIDPAWQRIIHQCAASNTFRGLRNQPSVKFRSWAIQLDVEAEFKSLIQSPDAASFDDAHNRLVDRLVRDWGETGAGNLALYYGQAAKLINLAVRAVCESAFVSKPIFDKAVNYIHVPLDQCVLTAIKDCSGLGIESQPSMSTVKDKKRYYEIQTYIRDIARKAGVFPILVDYVAWDKTHSKQ